MSSGTLDAGRAAAVGRVVSDLRAQFVSHDAYVALQDQFDLLLHRRRADLAAGRTDEARGIVVVGNPGSGKSTAMGRLFHKHPDLRCLEEGRVEADVVSFLVPSPATLKQVGLSCLTGLGYPLRRDRTATIIWELVQNHLRQRRTLFLHLDEVQDLYVNRSPNERQAVVNTLKSLMQNRLWPTGIILSGTMALKGLVNLDPQLARRLVPIEFASIAASTHTGDVRAITAAYAAAAGLATAPGVLAADFVRRLIHAGADELGLVIELVISAIEEVVLAGAGALDAKAFARAFRRRSGCHDALNPFLSDDWRSVDARLLLQRPDGPGEPRPEEARR